ncbi:hypothetical protein [Variovorax paradoxus]|uniref:Uncharacterized protein n=1 Tax=Variovorax paradoxus TaxID=34073 RepID=A0A0H2LWS3_VARPD|nr:hypothetical protein [Variovorax paradoxus]KLN54693.1 hypothetical protein VPARA_39970 [Variovorax paradoxus]
MDADTATHLLILGAIAQMPPEDRTLVEACAAEIRHTLKSYGEHGSLALGLVGAEIAAE